MQISFLGAAEEVGRSAILVENEKKILLDYGVKVNGDGPVDLPHHANPDMIFLSHGHLDHCGALPYLVKAGYRGLIGSTELTFQLSRIMLEDSAKIAREEGYPVRFSKADVEKTMQKRFSMEYDKAINFGSFSATLSDAGHIPGSGAVFLDMKPKSVFYTGDIRLTDTRLLLGAKKFPKADILVMESTYGQKKHPNRNEEERRFANMVEKTVERGGVALVPTFATGRAQEILLILLHYIVSDYPVYLDGMARSVTNVVKKYYSNLRGEDELERICKRVKFIKDNRERKKILDKPGIIVSTAGFLQAGPSVFYMRELCLRNECSVLIPGFQVEDTPGRKLVDTGKYDLDDGEVKVGMEVGTFDFSAHGDREELFEVVRRVKPEKVFCVHGDQCDKFASDIRKELNVDAHAPELGEEVEV